MFTCNNSTLDNHLETSEDNKLQQQLRHYFIVLRTETTSKAHSRFTERRKTHTPDFPISLEEISTFLSTNFIDVTFMRSFIQ